MVRPTGNTPKGNISTFQEKYGFVKDIPGMDKLIEYNVAQKDNYFIIGPA